MIELRSPQTNGDPFMDQTCQPKPRNARVDSCVFVVVLVFTRFFRFLDLGRADPVEGLSNLFSVVFFLQETISCNI